MATFLKTHLSSHSSSNGEVEKNPSKTLYPKGKEGSFPFWYCAKTGIYSSKHPTITLPDNPFLDVVSFIFTHKNGGVLALVDSITGISISYSELYPMVKSIASGLHQRGFSQGVSVIRVPEILVSSDNFSESSDFNELISSDPNWDSRVKISQQDTAAILYSSGTMGAGKGVILTHGNFITMMELFVRFEASQYEYLSSENVYLAVVPMFHVYGLSLFVMGLLSLGTTIVVMRKFNADEMVKAIERYGVTHFPTVPPLLMVLTGRAKNSALSGMKSLKQVSCGAAPVSMKLIEDFVRTLPSVDFIQITCSHLLKHALERKISWLCDVSSGYVSNRSALSQLNPSKKNRSQFVVQGYGMAESTAIATRGYNTEKLHNYSSVGLLAPNMQAKVVDWITGSPLPPNYMGELWLSGPGVMKVPNFFNVTDAIYLKILKCCLSSKRILYLALHLPGYLNNLEATKSTVDGNGWLHTGDIAYFDEEGYLYVIDRLKEIIKYKGFQIAPAYLEAVLVSHPDIIDTAVTGIVTLLELIHFVVIRLFRARDEETGKIPVAFVVKRDGCALSQTDVIDFVSKQVAPYKKIRKVYFRASIPRLQLERFLERN
ncbi:hypothetical protein RND71_012612 [Anisodus tanguticus]|uniref:4-coumarate--CoA ligase n=1 Tax=Anisodus tanguticus TaxID=243964 RepID=A0AAE1SEZ6_9SOLA|nr:hypothetical protein RND71_012612 [Anisodus tanguticus]